MKPPIVPKTSGSSDTTNTIGAHVATGWSTARHCQSQSYHKHANGRAHSANGKTTGHLYTVPAVLLTGHPSVPRTPSVLPPLPPPLRPPPPPRPPRWPMTPPPKPPPPQIQETYKFSTSTKQLGWPNT